MSVINLFGNDIIPESSFRYLVLQLWMNMLRLKHVGAIINKNVMQRVGIKDYVGVHNVMW